MSLILAAAAAASDLIFKKKIEDTPSDRFPRDIASGNIRIEQFHNPGFSLGRGSDRPALVSALVTVLFTFSAGSAIPPILHSERRSLRVSLALILGGGFSNLTDRLTRGYVVDYIRFPRTPFRRLIMNIGDLSLFTGAGLLILSELFHRESTPD